MCGVGVVCIGATWGRVGGMGVCLWVRGGGGARDRGQETSQAKDNTVCVGGGVAGV